MRRSGRILQTDTPLPPLRRQLPLRGRVDASNSGWLQRSLTIVLFALSGFEAESTRACRYATGRCCHVGDSSVAHRLPARSPPQLPAQFLISSIDSASLEDSAVIRCCERNT